MPSTPVQLLFHYTAENDYTPSNLLQSQSLGNVEDRLPIPLVIHHNNLVYNSKELHKHLELNIPGCLAKFVCRCQLLLDNEISSNESKLEIIDPLQCPPTLDDRSSTFSHPQIYAPSETANVFATGPYPWSVLIQLPVNGDNAFRLMKIMLCSLILYSYINKHKS